MKKILTILAAFIIATCNCFAATTTTTNWNATNELARVNRVGTKLLKAYNLPQNITFKISEEDHVNAYANIDKEVYVYKGLLQFVQDDQELGAVIAHEIGHIINAHCAKQGIINMVADVAASSTANTKYASAASMGKDLAMLKMSRNDEYEADLTGVDLMVKAGIDPKAMISVLNKICENSIDVLSTHPSGINRLMNIYDYYAYTYPTKLKSTYTTTSYATAITAINANVNARNAKKNGAAKQNKKMAKLAAKRAKQMARNSTRTADPWNTGVTVVNTINALSGN